MFVFKIWVIANPWANGIEKDTITNKDHTTAQNKKERKGMKALPCIYSQ
jgi:hypothetical protein